LEGRQRKLALAGLAAFLISAAAPAEEGAATGRLTLNGETVSLRYAYALAQPGFFDKSTEDVRLARLRSGTPPDSRVVGLACPTPASAVATINGMRASDGSSSSPPSSSRSWPTPGRSTVASVPALKFALATFRRGREEKRPGGASSPHPAHGSQRISKPEPLDPKIHAGSGP
jgi:hypothetical protein